MTQDRKKHRRRSIRLPGYDYTSPGFYFVTVCVRGGECVLGEVAGGEMRLSDWGHVAGQYWRRIPDHFQRVELDAWVVMPNHMHGIIVIIGRGEASLASTSSTDNLTSNAAWPGNEGAPRDAHLLQLITFGPSPARTYVQRSGACGQGPGSAARVRFGQGARTAPRT
jgi:hypothetical protein